RRVLATVRADQLDIVGPQAALEADEPQRGRHLLAAQIGHQGLHACDDEEGGRLGRDQGPLWQRKVLPRREEGEIALNDLRRGKRAAHDWLVHDILLQWHADGVPVAARRRGATAQGGAEAGSGAIRAGFSTEQTQTKTPTTTPCRG